MRGSLFGQVAGMAILPSTLLGILPVGCLLYMHGTLSAETFLAVIVLSFGVMQPLITAFSYTDDIVQVKAIVGEVAEVLSGEDMRRPESAEKLTADNAIQLKDVRFAYHDKEVLHGIDLHIAPGTVNALVGPSGSGKSTLAVALGEKLGLPVVHLDQLWWKEGWRNVTREEFDSRLAMAMNMDGWIIDGNYSRTMEMRLAKCDTVIYLDFGRWACLRGMCQRVFGNYGKARPDMAQGCPERFDPSFVKWIWNYNKNNRVRNYMYLAQAKHAKTIVLKNRKEIKAFLRSLGDTLPD